MTMYRVDLVQTVIEETTVYVEANNKEDAGKQALRELGDDDTGKDRRSVEWHFADSQTDPEILAVEPVERSDLAEKWAKREGAIDALRP